MFSEPDCHRRDGSPEEREQLFLRLRYVVMAMTASVMSEDRQKIVAAGFDGYQSKPINVTDFVAAVAQLLEHRRP